MPVTTASKLDERYGRARPRRGAWALLAVAASLIIGVGIWWTVSANLDAVDGRDIGYEVIDRHSVQLSFQVTAPSGREVVCALQALDEVKGIVGWKLVRLPVSEAHTRAFTERIPTVAPATTGLVKSCWVS